MSRLRMLRLGRSLALCCALSCACLFGGASAAGELHCEAPGNLLRWPEELPVWELCWLYPGESSGPSGSGLELRDVRYRGVPVLARAQVPVVWAEMAGDVPGCSGRCFRTWTWQTSRFGVGGEVVPGYFEIDLDAPPAPGVGTLTACDRPAGAAPGECPWGEAAACGEGVAVERWDEGFRLTTQLAAGWFRYVMRWTFHRDGTLEPRFGFARGGSACADAPTVDSAVWRLDLDVGGRRNRVEPATGDGAGESDLAATWRVTTAQGNFGYRLRAGSGDLGARWWVTPHVADALTDAGRSCAFDPEGLQVPEVLEVPEDLEIAEIAEIAEISEPAGASPAEAEPPPEGAARENEEDGEDGEDEEDEADRPYDAVLWYRASAGGDGAAGCRWVGPTLEPIGRWPPPRGPRLFADGFESGGLDAWIVEQGASAPAAH